jgi:uncharacterized protein YdeI (YjbR/CyaY-like superfamily)
MNLQSIAGCIVHKLPADLKAALLAAPKALAAWADITPLARNEWICWVTSPKKTETMTQHIQRAQRRILLKASAARAAGPAALIAESGLHT